MGSVANGTCVIGQLTNFTAFASVEQNGQVWIKSYPNVEAAIQEAKGSGLVDRLFAAAAAKYMKGKRRHCVAPITAMLDPRKLTALGFAEPRSGTLA